MSGLRRRIFGSGGNDESSDSSREHSPAPAPKEAGGEAYRVIPKEKLEKLKKNVKHKGGKKRNAWVFGLGSLFGLFLAGYFASSNGSLDKLVTMAGLEDLNLDTVLDVLPAGLIRDVRDLQVCRNDKNIRAQGADVDQGLRICSLVRSKPSITIRSPSDYTLDQKAYRPNTPSL